MHGNRPSDLVETVREWWHALAGDWSSSDGSDAADIDWSKPPTPREQELLRVLAHTRAHYIHHDHYHWDVEYADDIPDAVFRFIDNHDHEYRDEYAADRRGDDGD